MQNTGSNLIKNKRYDQIFYYSTYTKPFTEHGGVLYFNTGSIEGLYPIDAPTTNKFTYEMSGHLPLRI